MAQLNFRVQNALAGTFRAMDEADSAAATIGGWRMGKTSAGNSSELTVGTESTGFTSQSSNPKPNGLITGASPNAWRSVSAYTGSFAAAAAWTIKVAVRSVNNAFSGVCRARVRVFASVNADGSSARELTTATQVGTNAGPGSTSSDVVSTVTWTPASTIILNNEYIFIAVAWEIITASGSNSADADLRTGSGTTVTGSNILTSDFHIPTNYVESATISCTTTISDSDSTIYVEQGYDISQLSFVSSFNVPSGGNTRIASKFYVPVTATLNTILLYLARTGLPINNLTISIQADSSGFPSGTDLTSISVSSSTLTTTLSLYEFSFPQISLTGGNYYWMVLTGVQESGKFYLFNVDDDNNNGLGEALWNGSTWTYYNLRSIGQSVSPGAYYILNLLLDNNAVTSITSVSSSEIYSNIGTNYVESATIGSKTSIPPIFSFGMTSIGSVVKGGLAADLKRANKYTATGTGRITNYAAYLYGQSGATGQQPFRLAIYSDNAGIPDVLLGYSVDGLVLQNDTPDWYFLESAVDAYVVAGQNYWITIQTGTSTGVGSVVAFYGENGVAGNRLGNTDTFSDGLDSPFGVNSLSNTSDLHSIYVQGLLEKSGFTETQTISMISVVSSSEVYTPLGGTNYTDSTTIASKAAVSSTEISGYVETNTVSASTKITSTDISARVDSSIINSRTTPSSSDISGFVDNNIASTVSSISAVEINNYIEVSTTSIKTVISAVESRTITDAATVSGQTTPIINDLAAYVDSATLGGATTTSSSDVLTHSYSELATIGIITQITYTESVDTLDSGIISSISSVTSLDLSAFIDSSNTLSITIPSATEFQGSGNNDVNTISSATSLSSVDVAGYLDASSLSTETAITSSEGRTSTDAGQAQSNTSVGQGTDTTTFVDSAQLQGISTITGSDLVATGDSQTVISQSSILFSDVVNYIDSTNPQTSSSVLTTEFASYIDISHVSTTTLVAGQEEGAGDSALIESNTSVNSVEHADFVDRQTSNSTSEITSQEQRIITDSGLISSSTVLPFSEIAGFIESDSIRTSTAIDSVENQGGTNLEIATFSTETSISATEIASYVDSGVATSSTKASYAEFAEYVNSSSLSTKTAVSTFEGQTNTYVDSATLATSSSVTSSDQLASVDILTANSTSSLSSTELISYVDSGVTTGRTTPATSDLANYADSGQLATATVIGSSEFTGSGTQDQASVSGQTLVTYTESAQYAETSPLVTSSTSALSTETAGYSDFSVAGTTTTAATQEVYSQTYVDDSVVTSVTSITAQEFYRITIVVLEGFLVFKWNYLINHRWDENPSWSKKWNFLHNRRWSGEFGINEKWSKLWIH